MKVEEEESHYSYSETLLSHLEEYGLELVFMEQQKSKYRGILNKLKYHGIESVGAFIREYQAINPLFYQVFSNNTQVEHFYAECHSLYVNYHDNHHDTYYHKPSNYKASQFLAGKKKSKPKGWMGELSLVFSENQINVVAGEEQSGKSNLLYSLTIDYLDSSLAKRVLFIDCDNTSSIFLDRMSQMISARSGSKEVGRLLSQVYYESVRDVD